MKKKFSHIPLSSILPLPDAQKSAAHKAELVKLTRLKRQAWIQLDSTKIQTRYQLTVLELRFQPSETTASIQASLRNVISEKKHANRETSFNEFYLVAQAHTDALFYNITDYVQRCVNWDLSVAERLRGRTILYIYQTEKNADDLLSDSGVKAFINRHLTNYIAFYGPDAIIGFAIELPHFLSVLDGDGLSIPWTGSMLKFIDTANFMTGEKGPTNPLASFLPFLFSETYNSPVVRSVFWQELTSKFARCFLGGIRDFCHRNGLRFAVTLRESARSLQSDLGTLLEQADCPVLIAADSDTSRRFVVAKSVCSNTRHAGILRKNSQTLSQCPKDASLGFNKWILKRIGNSHSDTYPYQSLVQTLQGGEPKRHILMLSPTHSLWMKPEEKKWNNITKDWGWLCQTVWNIGYDFDIISEAQFVNTSVDKKKRGIYFNREKYNLVLIPSCLSLHETTVQRLTEFAKAKGRLIANAPVPYLLNGRIGLEPYLLERLIYKRQTTILDGPEKEREAALKKYLRNWVPQHISVYSKQKNNLIEDIQVHHRQDEDAQTFYLFSPKLKPIKALVEITGEAKTVEEQDLHTGKQVPVHFWHANGNTYLDCTFEPEQGRLFVISS